MMKTWHLSSKISNRCGKRKGNLGEIESLVKVLERRWFVMSARSMGALDHNVQRGPRRS